MQIKTNAVDELVTAKELVDTLSGIEERCKNLKSVFGFYTVDDVVKLTGISEPKVLDIFNRKDFPLCDYGRKYIVSISAFWDYFNNPVKKEDEAYLKEVKR